MRYRSRASDADRLRRETRGVKLHGVRRDVLRRLASGATMSSIGPTYGRAVAGVVSVLFTSDHRVFFEHDDDSIRLALDWECEEVLLQMMVWRDRFVVEADELFHTS